MAIITGGAGALGGAMAIGLAQQGMKLGILGRNLDKLHQKVAEINQIGGEAIALQADVLNEQQLMA